MAEKAEERANGLMIPTWQIAEAETPALLKTLTGLRLHHDGGLIFEGTFTQGTSDHPDWHMAVSAQHYWQTM